MPATLSSNDGEARLTVACGAPSEYGIDLGFESSIHLTGRHWDGDHTFPFSILIEGLWLRLSSMEKLRAHIVRWTGFSLERLVSDELDGAFELASLPRQRLAIRFGPRPDSDYNVDHPTVTVSYSAGSLVGESHFVTDQSCLGIFAQEISAELKRAKK